MRPLHRHPHIKALRRTGSAASVPYSPTAWRSALLMRLFPPGPPLAFLPGTGRGTGGAGGGESALNSV